MNPKNFTFSQWCNFAAFALTNLMALGFWADFLGPKPFAVTVGVVAWVVSLLNVFATGKIPVTPAPTNSTIIQP